MDKDKQFSKLLRRLSRLECLRAQFGCGQLEQLQFERLVSVDKSTRLPFKKSVSFLKLFCAPVFALSIYSLPREASGSIFVVDDSAHEILLCSLRLHFQSLVGLAFKSSFQGQMRTTIAK